MKLYLFSTNFSKRLLFLILPVFSSLLLSAQVIDPANLQFEYLSIENGLPHNKANAVTMDKDGFMWFGTNDGICRYDGFNLKNYPLDQSSKDLLRTPQISVIKTDSKGNLLIGTYSLFRYNYSMDRIEQCDTSAGIETLGRVYAIEEGTDGQIWIGCERGLFSYNTVTDSITAFPSGNKKVITIISLLFDNGILWAGTRNEGLLIFDTRSKSFSVFKRPGFSTEGKNQVNCLFKDKNNLIWAGTQDNGIFKFNPDDSGVIHIFPNQKNNLSYRIRKIINDRYGNIWIGCRLGIFLQKNGTDSLVQVRQIDPLTSKSRSNSIYDIFIDRNEIMWVGTFSFGVSFCDFKRKPFYLYNLSDEATLFFAKMINCFSDCDIDNVWIGTEESGLFCFNRRTLKFRQFLPDGSKMNSLAGVNIKRLAKQSDGNLWIGYYNEGLDYLNIKTGKISHFTSKATSSESIASNSVRALLLDDRENLWVGTNKGVDFLKKGSLSFHHLNLNIEVLDLYKDRLNRIWAGTTGNGIYRFNTETEAFEQIYSNYFTSTVKAILIDSKNNLWVGTNKGLFFVNSENDSIQHFGMSTGLPSNIILDILEDDNKSLWANSGAGLFKLEGAITDPRSLILKQYTLRDGLQGSQFRESATFRNNSGEFYFGGVHGFNIFMPDSIKSNPYPPKLAFIDLKIFNKSVPIGEKIKGKVILEKAINQVKELKLSYKHTPVSIEFASLHFSDPEKNKYKFRLLPIEQEWNYSSGIRNFATYSNLQGGDYTFVVEGTNNDGVWSSAPLILRIEVIPPFWKTWWFTVLIVLIISASVFGYYLYRISLLKRNNAELEKKVEDRTSKLRESLEQVLEKQNFIEEQSLVLKMQKDQLLELNSTKDKFFSIIAHDLRSPFQSLLGLSDILLTRAKEDDNEEQRKLILAINDSSNRLFTLVENLLTWARTQANKITYEPAEIELPSILDSAVSLLQPHLDHKNIILEKKYKPVKNAYCDRNMVEMVIRNLVTNAIKFTPQNGMIYITLSEKSNELQAEIRDEGVGISIEDQKKLFRIDSNFRRKGTNGETGTGLGLILCKEFIEKNNGRIWVESEPGKGSSFFFTIPVFTKSS